MRAFFRSCMQAVPRRFIAFSLGYLALTLNHLLGFNLEPSAQTVLATFVTGYIAQSAYKELKTQAKVVPGFEEVKL